MKGDHITYAVRIRFSTQEDLEKAIAENMVLQILTVRVEEASNHPYVRACYNWRKFDHIAAQCTSSKICRVCSGSYGISHEQCEIEEECINCKGKHKSSDKKFPKYKKLYQRLIEKR